MKKTLFLAMVLASINSFAGKSKGPEEINKDGKYGKTIHLCYDQDDGSLEVALTVRDDQHHILVSRIVRNKRYGPEITKVHRENRRITEKTVYSADDVHFAIRKLQANSAGLKHAHLIYGADEIELLCK